VYLDAFVPDAGKALLDYLGDRAESIRESARRDGEGWKIPPYPPERFGVRSQRDTEWLRRRLVPQPLRTFEQALPAIGGDRLERTYIHCVEYTAGSFGQFADRIREDRRWTYHPLRAGHDAMVTAPGEVAKLLLGK
jgi:hypothetical protein